MNINKSFRYQTFDPSTNTFTDEFQNFKKPMPIECEKRLKRWQFIQRMCLYLLIPLFIATITCGALSEAVSLWFLFGLFGGLCLLCLCIFYAVDMENHEDALYDELRDTMFDQEQADCEAYNAEQEAIAEEWRKEHPFEEKIRMAKMRGSSVDIAEMIKHYEEYIKK